MGGSLYFVVHTHWDREWYQPFQRMRARLVQMADRMLPLVESGVLPSFHFDGQTIAVEDYLELRPEAAPRIRALVRAGKLQLGPWYVLADSFLVGGESLIRNLEIGMSSAARFGGALDTGYLPDQFGHAAQLPQILAGFGFRTAVLWRGVPRQIVRNRFIWEAPDGSAVTTLYLPYGYSNGAWLPLDDVSGLLARLREIADRERDFAAGAPILVMNGTDHAEPDARLIERLREAHAAGGPGFEVGTIEDYLKRIAEPQPGDAVRHRGELRSPARAHLLPGVTSARTWIKQRDFHNCYMLERIADPLAALARLRGLGDGLDAFLDLAWRYELQNQPHDSICGCSIDPVHEDMRHRFDQAALIAQHVTRSAAHDLFGDGRGSDATVAVFNPTFSRTALVSGEAEIADSAGSCFVVASDGHRIAALVEPGDSASATRRRVSFVADNLEQAGFTIYRLEAGEGGGVARTPAVPCAGAEAIENEFYRLAPSARGISIDDLRSQSRLELYFEDEGDRGDEYNFDPVLGAPAIADPAVIAARVIENGTVRRRLGLELAYLLPAALTPDRRSRSADTVTVKVELVATLFAGLDRVDLAARIINTARDHRFRVAIRSPVISAESLSDTSFGLVRRSLEPTEPPGTEDIYPTAPHRTLTVVEGEQLSVALMSRGIYEVEARPDASGTALLLTLLRCVGWLSRSDLAMRRGAAGPQIETTGAQELGEHRFEFAVATWRGGYREGGICQRAQAYAFPPRLFRANLGSAEDLFALRCDNPNVLFSTARPAGPPGAFRVRAYSGSDTDETARFAFPGATVARRINLAGRRVALGGIRRGRDVVLRLRPFEIVTFEVKPRS
jgi:alpha-mannosidase